MATLKKLGVLGIRSFSPFELETMDFETPLTVITGHNGAGKTTIVESLKMACTGELPPNSNRGHNFIHDPELAQTNQVKAQIRLVFTGNGGHAFSIHRNMQLLQTIDRCGKVKNTFKQLEAAIAVKKSDDSRHQITSRCVDIDDQIPGLIGIPKAILENVVFVHQEESFWPLGDVAKLKKKFDDLFGATQYTKAVTALLLQKKTLSRLAKDAIHDEKMTKELYQQSQSLDKKIEEAKTNEVNLVEREADLKLEVSSLQSALRVLEEKRSFSVDATKRIQAQEQTCVEIEKEMAELKRAFGSSFSLMKDSLSELQDALHTLDSKRTQLRHDQQTGNEELKKLEDALDQSLRDRQKHTQQFEKIALYKSRVNDAVNKLQVIRDARSLTGIVTASSVNKMSNEVLTLLSEEQNGLHEILSAEESKRELTMNKLTKEATKLQKIKEKMLEKIASDNLKKSQICVLAEKINSTRDRLAALQEDLIRSKLALTELDASMPPTPPKFSQQGREQLDALVLVTGSMERDLTKLDMKVEHARHVEEIQSQMAECKSSWQKKAGDFKLSLSVLDDDYREKLEAHLKKGPAGANLIVMKLREWIEEKSKEHFEEVAIKKVDEEKLKSITAKLEALQKSLAEVNLKTEGSNNQLRDILPDIDLLDELEIKTKFDEHLAAERAALDTKHKNLLTAQNADTMYSNFLQSSVTKNVCAFCARPFAEGDVDIMKSHLKNRITSLPKAVDRCQVLHAEALDQFKTTEQLRQLVQNLRESVSVRQRIRLQIDELESERLSLSVSGSKGSKGVRETLVGLLDQADGLVSTATKGVGLNQWVNSFDIKQAGNYKAQRDQVKQSLAEKLAEKDRLNKSITTSERLLEAHREAEAARRQEKDALQRRKESQ
eukprot:GHVH01014053.1.p1 GENE.GHVH01014053.1~~GHVH01014053.1.p1  ORF type:complete len:889 (-),score=189.85 GHVH01014053.1:594-3260(-)